jgi:hypothetical protein
MRKTPCAAETTVSARESAEQFLHRATSTNSADNQQRSSNCDAPPPGYGTNDSLHYL